MIYKSFVDVLFILLLGTIVMLTESVHIGAVDVELLRLGSGGVSPVRVDEVELVVVSDEALHHGDRSWSEPGELARQLPAWSPVLLVVADRDVPHHRVMSVWSALSAEGLDVSLGAEPSSGGLRSVAREVR
jgi:biopolymer transport protein ExbD